jgi:hypothetical protein
MTLQSGSEPPLPPRPTPFDLNIDKADPIFFKTQVQWLRTCARSNSAADTWHCSDTRCHQSQTHFTSFLFPKQAKSFNPRCHRNSDAETSIWQHTRCHQRRYIFFKIE